MSKIKIIGISGVTNGGKTSLSKRLVDQFPGSIVIRQDDFFREEDDPNHIWIKLSAGHKHQNWESIGSINWDALVSQANLTLQKLEQGKSKSFLIIEGHLIFNYRHYPFSFDLKIFLTLPKDECFKRRVKRNYIPPDPDGYFDECIWPMYLQNKEEMMKNEKNIIFLDGTLDQEKAFREVLSYINGK